MSQSEPLTIIQCVDDIAQLNSRLSFVMDSLIHSDDHAPLYFTLESILMGLRKVETAINHEHSQRKSVDPFHPFGFGVRVGGTGVDGDLELGAHLGDLCRLHGVSNKQAKALHYPDGGLMLLPTESGVLGADIFLTAGAYQVFMNWVAGGAK